MHRQQFVSRRFCVRVVMLKREKRIAFGVIGRTASFGNVVGNDPQCRDAAAVIADRRRQIDRVAIVRSRAWRCPLYS